jgi:hypothetical protein
MSENKTVQTSADVETFLRNTVEGPRLSDAFALIDMMHEITDCEAMMWGPSIIGFDKYHYKYESGREGDSFVAGFSPRAKELAIYIMSGFDQHKNLLAKLGKHRHTKSCLYVKQLADVDLEILEKLISDSVKYMKAKYG